MLSGSAAVLAQCLTREQNDHWKNISYTICEREGGIQVSNTQLGTEQPFLSCFYCSSEMPIICALYNLFPGKAVPEYSCVLSGLILFKAEYALLLFWVAVSLAFLCLRLLQQVEVAAVIPEPCSNSANGREALIYSPLFVGFSHPSVLGVFWFRGAFRLLSFLVNPSL